MTSARDKRSRGDNHHGYDAATIHNISPTNPNLSASLRSSVRPLCSQRGQLPAVNEAAISAAVFDYLSALPGSRTVNIEPLLSSLVTITSPPIMRASLRDRARPSPVPP